MNRTVAISEAIFNLHITHGEANRLKVQVGDQVYEGMVEEFAPHRLLIHWHNRQFAIWYAEEGNRLFIGLPGKTIEIQKNVDAATGTTAHLSDHDWMADSRIEAPMPGKILKILVKEGQEVQANDRLFILEAMKMENEVRAPRPGRIHRIHFKENDMVSLGQTVMEMEFDD